MIWGEGSYTEAIHCEHIPLFDKERFRLVVVFYKSYERQDNTKEPGYFFVGVLDSKARDGRSLYTDSKNHIETAEEAFKIISEFATEPVIALEELKMVLETNGDFPELVKWGESEN